MRPKLGLHTRLGDHGHAASVGDGCAHEEHVVPVAHQQVLVCEHIGALVHGLRFAGERGLLRLQAGALQQACIGRHRRSGLQQHDVAGRQIRRGNLPEMAVAAHADDRHGHLLERGHGAFRPIFLAESQDGVEHHNGQNGDCVFEVANRRGDDGRHDEQDHHGAHQLIFQNEPRTLDPAFDQLVGAVSEQATLERRPGLARFRAWNLRLPKPPVGLSCANSSREYLLVN